MTGVKAQVLWSPAQEDLFMTCSTDLNLYRIENIEDGQVPKGQGMRTSEDTFATLVTTNSDHQYIKCIAWYPKPEPTNLVAVGLTNGRVVLTSFGKGNSQDPHRLLGKELVPKHQRQCSYLSWNPVESNLLAEGVERYRADFSVLIWDVYHQQRSSYSDHWSQHNNSDRRSGTHNSEPTVILQKPFVELGSGETTLSLAWFAHEPQSLVAGMNNKFLRIFDLRDTSRPQSVAYTKAVYGVRVDPGTQHRLASFHETHISIWDTRNFEKPVATLLENKNILKLAWSPTRSGLLGCLTKENPVVKLYDIQHSAIADEIEPPFAAERRITCPDNQIVLSFDWHPTQENRMLMISPGAAGVKDIKISERIAISWSPDVYLSWVCGRQVWQAHTIKVCREANEDISTLMRRRALKGYGIKKEISENTKIIADDPSLRNFWLWVKFIKELITSNKDTTPNNNPSKPLGYRGIKALVGDMVALAPPTDAMSSSRSWVELWSWQGREGSKPLGRRKIYSSNERLKAMELCGWTYNKDSKSSPIIDKLESSHQYERAAAIAVFNLKIGRAIEVLYNGAKHNKEQGNGVNLNMVAIALSGFSDEKESMWQGISSRFSPDLHDPYMRSMFAFLTTEADNYEAIMNDSDLDVSDRVAFACFYLPDSKLIEYIEKLTAELISEGDLNAVLLTGFTRDFMDLLQNYIDSTGDIQTAAVSLLQTLPNPELSKDIRLKQWVDAYRDLLDTWKLWHQRAEFDVYRQSCDKTARGTAWIQPQVFVSCNFCGKSVSFDSLATRSRTFMFGGTAAHKPRVTSCPSCRKPLPRCALCLMHMGTSAGLGSGGASTGMGGTGTAGGGGAVTNSPQHAKETDGAGVRKIARFPEWFTWCQTCRHGGHAEHMTQWYRDHAECPVTGCSCKCSLLDAMGSISTDDSHRMQAPS